MTQEDKELLLKDLCARLPYRIKANIRCCDLQDDEKIKYRDIDITYFNIEQVANNWLECKPYLRPMASMTEEEKKEVQKLGVCNDGAFHNDIYDIGTSMEEAFLAISWLLERHFDINYLIEKRLALKAPEGMYKIE